ncbi:MAG: ABC transporter ATP-binding protein [Tissierellia bacterium]|nr:ABC transporter ATP-binding protein [Tissierellia bacterium]
MLTIDRISKTYANGVTAVDNFNLEVEGGNIFGFIGPNGAGKTTSIKMIVGLLKPDHGNIYIDGVNIWTDSLEAKKLVAYVPDQPEVYTKLKGIEYLNFISDIYKIDSETRKLRIEKYTKLFNIYDDLDKLIEEYSHGMRQKIVLSAALIQDPYLLILDEPMVGLDPKSSFNLKELMKERAREGKIVFFSTHILEVAENLCDKIGIISKGKIIKIGTIEEFKEGVQSEKTLENIFLELTEND